MTRFQATTETEQFSGYVMRGDFDAVAAMVRDGFDINAEIRENRTALHLAADGSQTQSGSSKTFACERILALGADASKQFPTLVGPGYLCYSPLHYAAERQSLAVCKVLLEAGANPNARTFYDITPLHMLLQGIRNHFEWIPAAKLLLEKGADVNAVATRQLLADRSAELKRILRQSVDDSILTPLHCALFASRSIDDNIAVAAKLGGYRGADMIRALLEQGADPSFMPVQPPNPYMTPLQLAAKIGTAEDMQLLIDSPRADTTQKTASGRSLRQLTSRPEIQVILRAEHTKNVVLDSMDAGASKGAVRSKGFGPL